MTRLLDWLTALIFAVATGRSCRDEEAIRRKRARARERRRIRRELEKILTGEFQ